jgi:polyisoprenoid-binding protein YceI
VLKLTMDIDGLEVDRPEWRRDEGFERDPSASAIDGTRENLRSEAVLDAARHPLIEIESLGLRGPRWQPEIELRIRLRGETRELTAPIALSISDERIVAIGHLGLAQSDFGMEPFSVAGGQLAVADRIDIRFRIVAAATAEGTAASAPGPMTR